ncbi:hypothetical protein V2J09_017312 [Rumex salicifolius]
MITRHNLAEQLREYQIRSKHDWASASIFSTATSFTSSDLRIVGARNNCIHRFRCGFSVFQAYETGIHLSMCHYVAAWIHENHETSEIGPEEKAKDASSLVYVKRGLRRKTGGWSLVAFACEKMARKLKGRFHFRWRGDTTWTKALAVGPSSACGPASHGLVGLC